MLNFQYSRRAEAQYYGDILGIARQYFEAASEPLHTEFLSVEEWLTAWSKQASERMITHLYVENARSWKEAARKAGHGPEIAAALGRELRNTVVGRTYRGLITENAELIRSLPQEVRLEASRRAAKAAQSGERFNFIESELLEHVSKTKAALIARTEVAKANAALTEARASQMGLNWYVWRTSKDQRVRASHRFMDGVLIPYNNAPSPEELIHIKSTLGTYQAGNCPNCRCYQEPLLKFSQVNWPHRVYWNRRITMFTLSRFKELEGAQLAA